MTSPAWQPPQPEQMYQPAPVGAPILNGKPPRQHGAWVGIVAGLVIVAAIIAAVWWFVASTSTPDYKVISKGAAGGHGPIYQVTVTDYSNGDALKIAKDLYEKNGDSTVNVRCASSSVQVGLAWSTGVDYNSMDGPGTCP